MAKELTLRQGVVLTIALLFVVTTILSPFSLHAQQFFGSVMGTVADASGGVIPGATVTITNVGTNEKHTAKSDAAGNYQFVDLVPATYRVEVNQANFKRFVHENVVVDVSATVRVNAALQVGAASETVEVTTAGIELQTDSPAVSNKVEAQQVAELPLNGRNMMGLLNITAGVMPSSAVEQGATMAQNNGTSTNPLSWGGGTNAYAINGGDNETYIDGAPVNLLQGSNMGMMVTADAVQEFNIDTSVGDASEGRATGGVINVTAKTGTNNLHWTAYEYFRNAALNANTFFNKQSGIKRPEFNQNLYGFNLGFPVKKDKIFFFGSYEVDNVRSSSPALTNVPSNGNAFSSGGNIFNGIFTHQIVDPLGKCTPVSAAQPIATSSSTPAPGNHIVHDTTLNTWTLEQGCWDPLSTVFRTFWAQQPNTANPAANYAVNVPDGNVAPEMNARLDWVVSPKQRIFAHTAWWAPADRKLTPFPHPDVPSGLPGGAPWNLGMGDGNFNSNLYILGDTYTLNTKTVLDVRAEWLRFRYTQVPTVNNFNYGQMLNSNWGALASYIPAGRDYLPGPAVNGGGTIRENLMPGGLGFTNGQANTWATGSQSQQWNNYGVNATLNYVAGKHSLKFGLEARLMDQEVLWSGWNGGSPSFGNQFSSESCPSGQQCGDEFADLLLGYFTSINFGGEYGATEFNYYQAYFASDTWQFNRKLTISLGARYELPGGIMEKKDSTGVVLPYATDPNTLTAGTEALVNSPMAPSRSIYQIKKNIVNPRLGFAYRLDDKTVIRGGYGITSQAIDEDHGGNGVSGFATNNDSLRWTNPNGGTPTGTLSNPIPNPASVYVPVLRRSNPAFLQQLAFANQITGGVALTGNYPVAPLPYYQQYNFTVQRQFGTRFQVTAAYVGSHAIHLLTGNGNGGVIDQLSPSQYTVGTCNGAVTAYPATGPYAGVVNPSNKSGCNYQLTDAVPVTKTLTTLGGGSGTYSGVFCSPNGAFCNNGWKIGQTLEPYPNYSNVTITNQSYGNQTYNALQVNSQYRIQGGGLFGLVYTWAKTMNDYTSNQDWYNHRGDRTVNGVPMRLAFNLSYPLPIGQGQKFLNTTNPVVSRIISGWTLNDITSYQHGNYLSITANSKNNIQNNFNGGTTRANYTAGCNKTVGGSDISRLNGWFNTSCFSSPAAYSWGNETANDPQLFAAGIHNWDLSLLKTTKIAEKTNLQFRLETFNTFNHFQPGAPNTAAGNGNFGKITSQANNPRWVQLSLRVSY